MRFIVMSDPHFTIPNSIPDGLWWYKTLASRAKDRNSSLVRTLRQYKPDFIVNCGDFTGDGNSESFLSGRNVMEQIGCEWRTVVGNHDTNWPGVRSEVSALYNLSKDINYYSHLIHTEGTVYCFIFLDLCWHLWQDGKVRPHIDNAIYNAGDILKFAVDDEQLTWFKQTLEANHNAKIIIVTHTPIIYKDKVKIGTLPKTDSIVNSEYPLNTLNPELEEKSSNKLKAIIQKHHTSIKVIFSGHTHIHEVIYKYGIPFCTTAALRECPFEFRVVDVENDKLVVSTHSLDDPTLFAESYEAWRNNDWILGKDGDRNFEIALGQTESVKPTNSVKESE